MPKLQRYVSDELTHFVGRGKRLEEQYRILIHILKSGWLTHRPHNPAIAGNLIVNKAATLSQNEMYNPQVVCFCDIPVQDLAIHMQKYSSFGLSFAKAFLVRKGASPVFYIAKDSMIRTFDMNKLNARLEKVFESQLKPSTPDEMKRAIDQVSAASFELVPRSAHFDSMVNTYARAFGLMRDLILRQHTTPGVPEELMLLQDLSMFFDFHIFGMTMFFDHAKADDDPENLYMEREWRVIGNVDFSLDDVERVIIPRDFRARLRSDLPEYTGQVQFVD